jgi:isoquinoline 1-oxidoreductase/isoquinoline 1-oxidoreductase beta subunit
VRNVSARSMQALFSANTNIDWFSTEGASDTPYRIPNLRCEYTPIDTGIPVGFWRSVGHSFNAFTMESFIDELAHAAGEDPYTFRRRMLPAGSRARRVLDEAAKLGRFHEKPEPGLARGIARHTAFDTEVAEVVEAGVVDGRIRVTRVFCVVDCGVVINPDVVTAQMEGGILFGLSAALDQEITMKDGIIQQDNYDSFPALRMFECPEIVVKVVDSHEPPTGAGEPGLPPIAPAVANAVFAGTGVRLRRMPLQRAWDERGAAG